MCKRLAKMKLIQFAIVLLVQSTVMIAQNAEGIDIAELKGMDREELRLARNSIFARHGRPFKSGDLQRYFNAQPWYRSNPQYSDTLLTSLDKQQIKLISYWEKSNEIFWEHIIDLDGDGGTERCFILKDLEIDTLYYLLVENSSIEIQTEHAYLDYFGKVFIEIIDFNIRDGQKEIRCTYYEQGNEDPPVKHAIISYKDGRLTKSILPSINQDLFWIDLPGNGTYKVEYECPPHLEVYKLFGTNVNLYETIQYDSECPELIAACFTAGTQIATGTYGVKSIENIRLGDTILTFDSEKKEAIMGYVKGIHNVKHSDLVEISFQEDTLTCTLDHPLYIKDKGWCSFQPEMTMALYEGFTSIGQINEGDLLVGNGDQYYQILSVSPVKKEQLTYTITGLSTGDSYYANGVLTAVENIKNSK